MRALAIADHEVPGRAAITVHPGDTVEVARRDSPWPAFVFISSQVGEGWVPSRYLDDGRPVAVVLQAYTTLELAVRSGASLTVVSNDEESGWSWCSDSAGDEGWVPNRVLRFLS